MSDLPKLVKQLHRMTHCREIQWTLLFDDGEPSEWVCAILRHDFPGRSRGISARGITGTEAIRKVVKQACLDTQVDYASLELDE